MENKTVAVVNLNDYLVVVEERELAKHMLTQQMIIKNKDNQKIEELEEENETLIHSNNVKDELIKKQMKEKIEKDVKIEGLKETVESIHNEFMEVKKDKDYFQQENERLQGEIEELKHDNNILNDTLNDIMKVIYGEKEDTYTLIYGYMDEKSSTIKEYKQTGLLKDEYEIMFGMDSDNWLYHTLVKEGE